MKARRDLKTAWIVKLFSIGFLLAPLGNVMLSLKALDHKLWYRPDIVLSFVTHIEARDQFWLACVFVAGLLLFFPRRWTWTWAMVVLVFVTLNNAWNLYQADTSQFRLVGLLTTPALVALLFYLRYPYLERRDSLLPGRAAQHRRWETTASVLVSWGEGQEARARLVNVSERGARVQWDESSPLPAEIVPSAELKLSLGDAEDRLSVDVSVVHADARGFGCRFTSSSASGSLRARFVRRAREQGR